MARFASRLLAGAAALALACAPAAGQTVKIPQLPDAGALTGNELTIVDQSASTRKATLAVVAAYIAQHLPAASIPRAAMSPAVLTKSLLDFVPDPGLQFSIAAGTYTGDTTAYLQAALNACNSPSDSNPVSLSFPQVLLRTSGVALNGNNCLIHAEGATLQSLQNANTVDLLAVHGNNAEVFGLIADANHAKFPNGNGISAMVVTGDMDRFHGVKGIHGFTGILFQGATHPEIDTSEAYDNTGAAGFIFSGVKWGRYANNFAHDNNAEGFSVDNGSQFNLIIGNRAEHNGIANAAGTGGCFGGFGSGAGSNYNTFTGNISINNTCWGYGVQGLGVTLTGNVSQNNAQGGIFLSYYADASYPASELGHDVVTGNTTTEAPFSIFVAPGVPAVVGLENNQTNGVPSEDHSGTLNLAAAQSAPLSPEQCRFGEINGSTDYGFVLAQLFSVGQACKLYNNSTVAQTIKISNALFLGPGGNGSSSLLIPPGTLATFIPDGYNYIVTTVGTPAIQVITTTGQTIDLLKRLVEITGSSDTKPVMPTAAAPFVGKQIRVFNNTSIAQTLTSGGGNFVGPQGTASTTLSLAANSITTLESDGFSWITTVQK